MITISFDLELYIEERLFTSIRSWFCQDFLAPLKSLACKFRVILGRRTRSPSKSLVIWTWQPNLEVSVNPKARSSMSFSSSSGSGILSYMSLDSTMTWQVEQAQDPPHAPELKAVLVFPE